MKQSSILFVGLDVHKDSIDITTAQQGRDGDVRVRVTVRHYCATIPCKLGERFLSHAA